MDEIYTSKLYCHANELAHALAATSNHARIGLTYIQMREDDQIWHYVEGFYHGPCVELRPSTAVETYEMSHSALRSYKDDCITGYYSASVIDLGPGDEIAEVNVRSLQGAGEIVHGALLKKFEAIGEEGSFNISEVAFADTMVIVIADLDK